MCVASLRQPPLLYYSGTKAEVWLLGDDTCCLELDRSHISSNSSRFPDLAKKWAAKFECSVVKWPNQSGFMQGIRRLGSCDGFDHRVVSGALLIGKE